MKKCDLDLFPSSDFSAIKIDDGCTYYCLPSCQPTRLSIANKYDINNRIFFLPEHHVKLTQTREKKMLLTIFSLVPIVHEKIS